MSLIHEALKSMDVQPEGGPATKAVPLTQVHASHTWVYALYAFLGVIVIAGLAWYIWQSQEPKKAQLQAVMPVASAVQVEPRQQVVDAPTQVVEELPQIQAAQASAVALPELAAAPVIVKPAPVSESVSVPVAAPAPVVKKVVPKENHVHVVQSVVPPTAVSTPARQVVRQSKPAAPTPAVAQAPAAEKVSVQVRFANFVAAMESGLVDEAQNALMELQQALPPNSLGLLRAQAWFDLRAQRDDAAAQGYRAILERLPGDEEAAINLASIQSRQQKHEDARATLNDALRLQPESAALRAALAQFNPMAR